MWLGKMLKMLIPSKCEILFLDVDPKKCNSKQQKRSAHKEVHDNIIYKRITIKNTSE